MTQVKPGDLVRIHYTGTLNDGTVFDSSQGRDPLEFEVGSGMIIPGLDQALPGMIVGEAKTVVIPPEAAYGPVIAEARSEVPRSQIPPDIPLAHGMQLQMETPEGQVVPVFVTDFSEETVTLDGNHPLAGKELTFAFEIVSVG